MSDFRRNPAPPIREPLRVSVGRLIDRLGQNGLALGIGIVVGYWAADFGTAWLPTMLEILAFYFALSLLFLLGGTWLQGRGVRDTEVGLRLRKRIAVFMVLILGAVVLRLAAYWVAEPGTLAGLPADELARIFDRDSRQVASLEAQLEALLEGLEERDVGAADGALAPAERRFLAESWRGILDTAFALDLVRRRYADWVDIGYSRRRRPLFLRGFLLATAAELALHEKALRLARRLEDAPEAAAFLDGALPREGIPEGTVGRFLAAFAGDAATERSLAAEGYLGWLRETFGERDLMAARRGEALLGRIRGHLAVIRGLSGNGGTASPDPQILRRPLDVTWPPAQERFAEVLTAAARGGTGRVAQQQLGDLAAALQPGDVLLGRHDAALDAVAIPGYWTSAALYLGSPEELSSRFEGDAARARIRALPGPGETLGEHLERTHPVAWSRYRASDPEAPLAVIVADPSGVHLTSLDAAVGDTVAVLRLRLPPATVAAALATAFEHLDAPYDFAFDFAGDHALSGTELVWRSYRAVGALEGLEPGVDAFRRTLPADALVAAWAAGRAAADPGAAAAGGADPADGGLELVYFLDSRPTEDRAVTAGAETLAATLGRGKWWVGEAS